MQAGQTYYLETDHLGTPRVAIDPARDVAVWRWDLKGEAFGSTAPDEDPERDGAAFVLDMRFPGQRYDRVTGLYYNYQRDYDYLIGRYVQSDPTGLQGGIASYPYAEGNPVSYIDPTGEIAFIPVLVGIGVGYAFDSLLEIYKKEHCSCKNTAIGPAGNSAMGGMIGGTGPFATKPRGGIAGGGPAGARTSTFSQINHGAASRGAYSAATRNGITRVLRKVPYAGTAMAAYGAYDALTCD